MILNIQFQQDIRNLVQALRENAALTRELTKLQIRKTTRDLARDDASTATFQIITQGGEVMAEVTAIQARVGGPSVYVQIIPRLANGTPDPTVENVVVTIDGSATGNANAALAPYGDGSDPKRFKFTGIAAGPDDVPATGNIHVAFDSDTDGGVQNVELDLPFTVTAENATTGTFETIDAPA